MKQRTGKRSAGRLLTASPVVEDPDRLLTDLRELIASGRLSNFGPVAGKLEQRLSSLWGAPTVAVANATLGLELAIQALGVRGKAIVPSFTFFSTAHACRRAGLEVVFADIDPRTYCLDPEAVEPLLDEKTSLVVPVHTYGNLADFDYFEALRERGIAVVYDAAHAMGVRSRAGEPAAFGDATVFSFHATKVVPAGEGGAVACSSAALAETVRRLSNFGLSGETEVTELGTNAKLSEIHALFALHGLDHMKSAIAKRLAVIERYREELGDLGPLTLPLAQPGVAPNGQFFPVRFDWPELRERVFAGLVDKGIHPRRYFSPPLHRLAVYRGAANGGLAFTEAVADTVLCLPLHSGLEPADASKVSTAIRRIVKPRPKAATAQPNARPELFA